MVHNCANKEQQQQLVQCDFHFDARKSETSLSVGTVTCNTVLP
jgi:hypothetical protein